MAAVTISIDPGELLGLTAVAELDEDASGRKPDLSEVVGALMHSALAETLERLGLPWAPSTDMVHERLSEVAGPRSRALELLRHDRTKRYAGVVLAVAVLVVLWGGYVQDWRWTGFRANNQVWDWLELLLLPIMVGTIPLWIKNASDITPARRVIYLAAIAVFAGFTALAYLVPLSWSGFPGKTLWDWFGLLLLPTALAIAPMVPTALRSLRPHHKAIITVLALGWALTIVGGYALSWGWTGYPGNTLWDWLQLLLLPLIVPIVLVPLALRWVSVAGRNPRRTPLPVHIPEE